MNNLREYLKKLYLLIRMKLFSKSNYKIYLRVNFEQLNINALKLKLLSDIASTEIIPLQVKAPFGDSILVIAPHQDDEIIGCGGAILSQLHAGGKVSVIFICDGGDEFASLGYSSRKELVDIRESESLLVAQESRINDITFLRIKDIENNFETLVNLLVQAIHRCKPAQIFTPFFLDGHTDHQNATKALFFAMKYAKSSALINGYEVWGNCIPNVILNIDDFIELKEKLISYYKSQCVATDYVKTTLGKNMYNSRLIGKDCHYAERYFQMPSEYFFSISKKIYSFKKGIVD